MQRLLVMKAILASSNPRRKFDMLGKGRAGYVLHMGFLQTHYLLESLCSLQC